MTLRRPLQKLFLYVGGTVICESLLLKMEYISRSEMHSALFYIVVMLGTPAVLVAIAVASRQRWACTIIAAVYTAFGRGVSLDPAARPCRTEARTGVPASHPLDPVGIPTPRRRPRVGDRSDSSALEHRGGRSSAGWSPDCVFLVTFIAVQWPFANFLMTPLARNWFFGTSYMDFSTPATSPYAHEPVLLRRIDAATVLARDARRRASSRV